MACFDPPIVRYDSIFYFHDSPAEDCELYIIASAIMYTTTGKCIGYLIAGNLYDETTDSELAMLISSQSSIRASE